MGIALASGGYVQSIGVSRSAAFKFRTTQVTANTSLAQQADAVASFRGFTIVLNNSAGKLLMDCKNASGSVGVATGTATVNDGAWHTCSFNLNYGAGTTQRLYVDGVLDLSITVSGIWGGTPNGMRLGRSLDTFWAAFIGDVAECGAWGVELTAEEHASLAKGFSPSSVRGLGSGAFGSYLPLVRDVKDVCGYASSSASATVIEHPRSF
jgi:hypothetical protein